MGWHRQSNNMWTTPYINNSYFNIHPSEKNQGDMRWFGIIGPKRVWDHSYLKRLVKGFSLLVNCSLVNKFQKKFRLHCRKMNVVRCVWAIECLLGRWLALNRLCFMRRWPYHHKRDRITRCYTEGETRGVAYCPFLTVCGFIVDWFRFV